jgi:hypothetical protein
MYLILGTGGLVNTITRMIDIHRARMAFADGTQGNDKYGLGLVQCLPLNGYVFRVYLSGLCHRGYPGYVGCTACF